MRVAYRLPRSRRKLLAGGRRIELHWLITSPRFSGPLGDQSPAPPACQRTKSLVAPERLALSIPKALVSKTSAMHSATGPWSTEWESNPSNQLCRLTPNRLVFSVQTTKKPLGWWPAASEKLGYVCELHESRIQSSQSRRTQPIAEARQTETG